MGKQWLTLFFWAPKSLKMVTAAMKLKDAYSLEGKLWPTSSQVKSLTQLCPTLCNPVDCSPPGSFVCGILQARLLEWIAILCSRGSSPPRDRSWVSIIAGRFFTLWATGKTGVNWPLVPVLGSLILWWGRGGWGSVASWEWFCDFVTRPSPVVFVCVRSELSPTCENGSDDREWREEAVRLSYWVPEEEDE